MNLLADENLDAVIVAYLRSRGHDVLSVAELSPSLKDPEVIDLALQADRCVITHDLDIAELVIRRKRVARGVVQLRFGSVSRDRKLAIFVQWWPSFENRVEGNLIVVDAAGFRVRSLSAEADVDAAIRDVRGQ